MNQSKAREEEELYTGKDTFLTDSPDRKPVEPANNVKARAKAKDNLALYLESGELHPVVNHIRILAQNFMSVYQNEWTAQQSVWTKADEMYWMKQATWRMQELTRAQVSGSMFQIVCRRLEDGAHLVTFPNGDEEIPIKFMPASSVFEPTDEKAKRALVADGLNNLALEHMRKARFPSKSRIAYHHVYKYATSFAYVPWEYKVEKRKRWKAVNKSIPSQENPLNPTDVTYTHADTGEQQKTPFDAELIVEEKEVVTADHTGFHPLKPEQIFADSRIDSMDRQLVVMHRADMTRTEIWTEALSGRYKNLEKITRLNAFQQYDWPNQPENQRKTDAGQTTTDSNYTEMYERMMVWMMLPEIEVTKNSKGEVTDLKWKQNAPECRYVMEVVGPLMDNGNIVVRLQESEYWGNGVPYIKYDSHQDDVGLYHRGLVNLLEDNMIQERTAKAQLMDNRTLLNYRPVTVISGRVRSKSLKIGQSTAFQVTSQDAIKQLDVTDFTQMISTSLKDVRDETNEIAQIPKFMYGQAVGARTSASEFAAMRDSGSAPALANYKTLNDQMFGGWLRKFKEYVPQFLDRDVAVKVLGPNGDTLVKMITADEFDIDMMVQEVAITAFDSKQTTRQLFTNMVVNVLSLPMFQGITNPVAVLDKLFQMFPEVCPNPEELFVDNPMIQKLLMEYQRQKSIESNNRTDALAGAELPTPDGGAPGQTPGQASGAMISGPAGAVAGPAAPSGGGMPGM